MLSLRNVYGFFLLTEQMFGEVVYEAPIEVFVHVSESVSLLGQEEHVEPFACADEGIDNSERIPRVDIVVDIAMYQHQVSFQLLGDLFVRLDVI